MKSVFRGIAASLRALVVGLVVFASTASARAQRVGWAPAAESQALGDRSARFFESEQARKDALPSYSLVREGPWPTGVEATSIRPEFGEFESKKAARVHIDVGTSLYGTGEAPGQLLRNGRRIVCWNTDAYGYDDSAPSLYQSHPWVLAVRGDGTSFGVLADTTYRCVVDTAYTDADQILFIAEGLSFPVIVIERGTPQDVLKELARLTGTMPLPPRWSLGYHQCRYSYFPDARVREVASGFRERKIPCDVIWFDIDYMEAFRIFSFDRGHFPDPKGLNAWLLSQGFHNVWMIDPGLKSRDDRGPADRKPEDLAKDSPEAQRAREEEFARFRALRDEGTKQGNWVRRSDGEFFEGEVWPGNCYFPDFTSPRVRGWWAGLYKGFLANGVTGVWNDMNEPAVFGVSSKTMPLDNRHTGDPEMPTPAGPAQGERAAGNHARYHNVYGMQMIRGTREGIAAARPEARPFVLSRANFVGGQRYGATWTGDNTADWYHLESSVPMALNVGLSGQAFIGPDIGGFKGNGDGKLFARWMGVGSLLPFARGHTGKENINKEPWAFGPEVEKTCREALNRRYRLLPYLYTLFEEASRTGLPVARPTFFADPTDPALRSEDDSFLLGADLLVVAQMAPDGSRVPVMPKGKWAEVMKSDDADLPRLYLRAGALIPVFARPIQHTGEYDQGALGFLVCPGDDGKAVGTLYEDAGDGYAYQKGEFARTLLQVSGDPKSPKLKALSREGNLPKKQSRELEIEFAR